MSRSYSEKDDRKLVAYIAMNNPGRRNRLGNKLYKDMVENEEWAQDHSWSAWREHYKKNRDDMDCSIAEYQDKHAIPRSRSASPSQLRSPSRNPFSAKDDKRLVSFLAKMAPVKVREKPRAKFGRGGNTVYRDILSNGDYSWAANHPWQSWRDRYIKNQRAFDEKILRWQEKHDIAPDDQLRWVDEYFTELKRVIPGVSGKIQDARSDPGQNKDNQSPVSHEKKRSRLQDNGDTEDQPVETDVRPLKKRKHGGTHDPYPSGHSKEGSDLLSSSIGSSDGPYREASLHRMGRNGEEIEESDGHKVDLDKKHESEPPSPHSHLSPNVEEVLHPPPIPLRTPALVQSRSGDSGDVQSLYPTLPTPVSDTPIRLPGGYPDPSPRAANSDATPLKVPSAVRSHPPTPPPTNEQSDASIPSMSQEPDTLSAVAKSQRRAEPSHITARKRYQQRDAQIGGVPSPTQILRSNPYNSIQTSSSQSLDVGDQRPRPPSPSVSLLSDEGFVTCSPAPKRTEVVHGLPKHPARSFRNNDRVRTRNVVAARDSRLRQPDDAGKNQDKDIESQFSPEESHLGEHTFRVPSEPESSPAPYVPSRPEQVSFANHGRIDQAAASGTRRWDGRVAADAVRHVPKDAPTSAYFKAPDPNSLLKSPTSQLPAETADVFVSTTPLQSGRNRDRYILGTSNLPSEPGTSTSSRNPASTPLLHERKQRGRSRRQTFPGLGSHSTLPDINLLAQLAGGRMKSRPSAAVWTRSSPDITILPERQPQRVISPNILSRSERAEARRGPLRKSVIPVVVDSQTQGTLPFSLEDLSPSTFGIIIREGLAASFKRLQDNHGFSAEVIERTWLQQNMDLLATDRKLHGMRIAAEMAANDEEFVQGSVANLAKVKERRKRVGEYTRALHPSVPATEPTPPTSTDYTPPVRSRAGHYRRFTEQGRHWEARQREIDLASRVSANSSPSTIGPSARRTEVPVWGDKEDEALRASSEDVLRELARKFGEKVLRQKSLALMMLDD